MADKTLWRGKSEFNEYEVAEQEYNGRWARVLFSGKRAAVQSGMALDGKPELLFDYNQRFLEVIEGIRPRRVLLIGGGAMTFPTVLLEALPQATLDVVELDPLMLSIAKHYFNFVPNARLNVVYGDGRQFLERVRKPYDMILLDAFSHLRIPKSLATLEAVKSFHTALRTDGMLAANIVSPYYGREALIIHQQLAAYNGVFPKVEVYPADATDSGWQAQNLVLVAQKGRPAKVRIRYDALPLPDLAHEVPLKD